MSVFSWLTRRERALGQPSGVEERLQRSIYTAVEPFKAWHKQTSNDDAQSKFGGVYNLEFSPNG